MTDMRTTRLATIERTVTDRRNAAAAALERAGLTSDAANVRVGDASLVTYARDAARSLRDSLADGSNEPRYAAAMTAIDALGRLWAVL
jgi:hypothetical protein